MAETDEVLTAKLRPGNAGSNTAIDHVTVLAEALAQLPASWRAGHDVGDDPCEVAHRVLIRADAGGASHWFAEECVDRNLEFTFGFYIDHRVRDGVMMVPTGCWQPAVDGGGARRDGAEVIELTDFVDLTTWPTGTRLIVRRERPHTGAQLSLFDTIEGFRHTAFITNQTSVDVAALELQQRQRARAENVIRDTKACGLANLLFDDIVNNDVWMTLCFAANDLLALGATHRLRRPTATRHTQDDPASTAPRRRPHHPNGRRLRLDHDWPWTATIIDAIHRVRTAFQALTVPATPAPQAAGLPLEIRTGSCAFPYAIRLWAT